MIENRITPACPYIFPSARRRSGMAARQVRRSVVIRNLQIRLLAMDSDQTPLGKGKDVLHSAARAAPLRQSVEQPWLDTEVAAESAMTLGVIPFVREHGPDAGHDREGGQEQALENERVVDVGRGRHTRD